MCSDVVGLHRITVKYADVAIKGSPFYAGVNDTSMVRAGQLPQGIVEKLFTFDGIFMKFQLIVFCFVLVIINSSWFDENSNNINKLEM